MVFALFYPGTGGGDKVKKPLEGERKPLKTSSSVACAYIELILFMATALVIAPLAQPGGDR